MSNGGFLDLLNGQSGTAAASSNQSIATLLAAIVTAVVGFTVQVLLFYILQFKYKQIYKPAGPRRDRVETWRRRNGRIRDQPAEKTARVRSNSSETTRGHAVDNDAASDSPINPGPHHAQTFPATSNHTDKERRAAAAINRRLRGTIKEAEDKGLLADSRKSLLRTTTRSFPRAVSMHISSCAT